MLLAYQVAAQIYKHLKQNIPEVPPYSFQIIESDHENNALLITTFNDDKFSRYYNEEFQPLSFRLLLISDKLAHKAQLDVISKITKHLANFWVCEKFSILAKYINDIQLFKDNSTNEKWIQQNSVQFTQEAQEYTININLLIKENPNVQK